MLETMPKANPKSIQELEAQKKAIRALGVHSCLRLY